MTEAELRMILQEGEGQKVEFRERAGGMAKDLVAFANASGGRIFLGIRDDGSTVGMSITNDLKAQVQSTAHNCDPAIETTLEELRDVLVVHVKEGEDKPYACSDGFFLRMGPTSQKLSRDELREFFVAEGKVRFDELPNQAFSLAEHFDDAKFRSFLDSAKITEVLNTPTMLVNLGVATRADSGVTFNNTGVIFFAKNLNDTFRHTVVTCALYKGTDKAVVLDRKDHNDDITSSIIGAMLFLQRNLPVRYEFTGQPRRKEVAEVPMEALREAVINAVCHRDYFERGANVMVEVFSDRIDISNPGGLPRGLPPKDFGKRSFLRNPNIASLLHRSGYIERMGTGIARMRQLMAAAALPEPQFDFAGDFFSVTFRRRAAEPVTVGTIKLDEAFSETFSTNFKIRGKRLQRIIGYLGNILADKELRIKDLAQASGVTPRTVYDDMKRLQGWRILKFQGPKKTGSYRLTEDGRITIRDLNRKAERLRQA